MARLGEWQQMGDGPPPSRRTPLRVLFVTAEMYPLAKTGGLADVCASLPKALAPRGVDVRVLMPGYPEALDRIENASVAADLGEIIAGTTARLVAGQVPGSGLPVWLLDSPRLFQRDGSPYQDPDGAEWTDNALRFAMLCHAGARIALRQTPLEWQADVVHAHDWHTGLIPLLLQRAPGTRPRSVFTVHNAAFQGNFPLACASGLQIPPEALGTDGVEFYGNLSFLQAGIRYADKVTTVSPTYAREIRTPEFGHGMEGVLEFRRRDLVGIMNGIDTDLWNPACDPQLPHHYSAADPTGKDACKASLQRQLGLRPHPAAPLVASINRLAHQKMSDVLLHELPAMMESHPAMQFALLGKGEKTLEQGFSQLAQCYPGRVSAHIGYTERLAHQLHAGADILIHASRFEPCGLSQLYAMRYGTIPVVRRVGGLADSVLDGDHPGAGAHGARGFLFEEATGDAMRAAMARCLDVFGNERPRWLSLQNAGMRADFSWSRSAQAYVELYGELLTGEMPPHARPPLAAAVRSHAGDARTLGA